MDYHNEAKHAVAEVAGHLSYSELYVVWFCKTLQNWKALVSTDAESGVYWEVTHNGDKSETYVDTYRKESNTVVPR